LSLKTRSVTPIVFDDKESVLLPMSLWVNTKFSFKVNNDEEGNGRAEIVEWRTKSTNSSQNEPF